MSKIKDNDKPVIDETLVADGLVFATRTDRYHYVGQWSWEKPKWLKQYPEKWRRLEKQELAQPRSLIEPEKTPGAESAEPNGQALSHDLQKDGDEESDVTLVNTPAYNSSPPYQPESGPAHVNENVPSGSTQTELPRSAEAVTRETNESETDKTPLEETVRKQGRAGGRPRKKGKLSARVLKARRKRMRAVLEYLKEVPILSHAASKAGIHRKTLEYWIKRSEAGDDGYDIEWQGVMWRFHEHVKSAIEEAHDETEAAAFEIAKGVLYKKDGHEVPQLYVRRPNGKMIRFLLESKRPEVYGKHPTIDIPRKGGVLVIGGPAKKPEKNCPPASIKARKWKSMSAMVRKTKG